MHHLGLSHGFWAELLLTIMHIINMLQSRPFRLQIPQEIWTNQRTNYEKLWIFGCEDFALVQKDDC